MKKIAIFILLNLLISVSQTDAFVVDHTAVQKFDQIPAEWLEKAKKITIHYGHTSHGSQIMAGLKWLDKNIDHKKYYFSCEDRNGARNPDLPDKTSPPSLRMWEEGLWPDTDDGHLGYWEGAAAWEGTDKVLDSNLFTVSGWAWCGQVGNSTAEYIDQYLQAMSELEAQHPDVAFVYMTGHREVKHNDPSTVDPTLKANNDRIRSFCRNNDKILFDFADIEAHDLDGNYHDEEDGTCLWCDDWCDEHPTDCRNLPERAERGGGCNIEICAHSHGLNCVIKAKAFWWMLARLARDTPDPDTPDPFSLAPIHMLLLN